MVDLDVTADVIRSCINEEKSRIAPRGIWRIVPILCRARESQLNVESKSLSIERSISAETTVAKEISPGLCDKQFRHTLKSGIKTLQLGRASGELLQGIQQAVWNRWVNASLQSDLTKNQDPSILCELSKRKMGTCMDLQDKCRKTRVWKLGIWWYHIPDGTGIHLWLGICIWINIFRG